MLLLQERKNPLFNAYMLLHFIAYFCVDWCDMITWLRDCTSRVWRSLLPRYHKRLWYLTMKSASPRRRTCVWLRLCGVLSLEIASSSVPQMIVVLTLESASPGHCTVFYAETNSEYDAENNSVWFKTCLHVRRGLPSTKCTYVGNYSRLNCVFSCCSS